VPAEGGHQPQLASRQAEVAPADRGPLAREVEQDQVVAHQPSILAGPRRRPAQQRLDAGEQLEAPERLRHVVVGAGPQPADPFELAVLGGQHQDRRVGHVAQALERRPPVEPRQADVEHDERGAAVAELPQRARAVGGLDDAMPRPLEQRAD
jgi:hypothetical protein